MSIHGVLILVHASAATVALLTGLIAVRSDRLVGPHAYAIIVMTATLIGAVITHPNSSTTTTAINAGLCAIALIMTVQAFLAVRRNQARSSTGPSSAIGFNCIGLVTAFVAVTTVQFTTNPIPDVAAPVATVLLGRLALRKFLEPTRSQSTMRAH